MSLFNNKVGVIFCLVDFFGFRFKIGDIDVMNC